MDRIDFRLAGVVKLADCSQAKGKHNIGWSFQVQS
jgi:hypothetical protein